LIEASSEEIGNSGHCLFSPLGTVWPVPLYHLPYKSRNAVMMTGTHMLDVPGIDQAKGEAVSTSLFSTARLSDYETFAFTASALALSILAFSCA